MITKFSNKIPRSLIISIIIIVLYSLQSLFWYSFGKQTEINSQKPTGLMQASENSSLKALTTQYSTLYGLCEQKYQAGITGHLDVAYQIKGQMDQILKEIQTTQQQAQAK